MILFATRGDRLAAFKESKPQFATVITKRFSSEPWDVVYVKRSSCANPRNVTRDRGASKVRTGNDTIAGGCSDLLTFPNFFALGTFDNHVSESIESAFP